MEVTVPDLDLSLTGETEYLMGKFSDTSIMAFSFLAVLLLGCDSSAKKKGCDQDACASGDQCGDESESSESDLYITPVDGGDISGDTSTTQSYEDEPYHCCGQGEGTSCCDGYDTGFCYQYGGFYKDCVQEGDLIAAKMPCTICCPGLQRSGIYELTQELYDGFPEGCGPSSLPPDMFVCILCGDGKCEGSMENRCNCPADCK